MPYTFKKFSWIGLLGALALLLVAPQALGSDDDDSPPQSANPITGTVVQLSWRGDDLFVQLDVNADGTGDLWVKIKHKTIIVDPQGNPLGLEAIQVGVQLTVTHYKIEHGYYEAYRVVVGAGTSTPLGQQPIQGKVLKTFWFGDDFFVSLDTDSDGQMDLRVKIKKGAIIADPQGNRLGFEAIQPGVTLTLISYKLDDDGYYEAWHVIVGEMAATTPPAGQPLVGVVLEVIPFGDDLFVRLDADGDGQEDYPVKIDEKTVIVDPDGNPLDRSAITVGVKLTVTEYQLKDGYYEAKHVIVGQ